MPVTDPDLRELAREAALIALEIHQQRHPRPSHVTQQQACELLGRSHVFVRRLIRSGQLRLNSLGRIPIEQIDNMLSTQPGKRHAQ